VTKGDWQYIFWMGVAGALQIVGFALMLAGMR